MRSTRQEEAWEWICRLEELAVQSNMKIRLLDTIRDCKRELEPELTESEWRQKCVEIGNLLEQVKKQLCPQKEGSSLETDVAERTVETLTRCRRANELLESEFCNGAAACIQETDAAMREFSNVKANYKEVTNSELFLKSFRNIGQKHKARIDDQQDQFVKQADQNYMEAFDRLSGLLSNTGIDETAKRKFYTSYYENKDTLMAGQKEYAHSVEKGESSIIKFSQDLIEPLNKLLSKLKRKAFFMKLLPVLVLLLYLAISKLPGYIDSFRTTPQITEQSQNSESHESILEKIIELIIELATFVIIKLPLVLLAILIYFLWCWGIKAGYRVRICNEAGKLLAESIERFRQENVLQQTVKESYQQVGTYMRRQYEGLLSGLLPGLQQEQDKDDGYEAVFASLCAEWEIIRRKVVES